MPSPKDLFHAAIAVILLLSVGAGQIPTASPLTERSSKVGSGTMRSTKSFSATRWSIGQSTWGLQRVSFSNPADWPPARP